MYLSLTVHGLRAHEIGALLIHWVQELDPLPWGTTAASNMHKSAPLNIVCKALQEALGACSTFYQRCTSASASNKEFFFESESTWLQCN